MTKGADDGKPPINVDGRDDDEDNDYDIGDGDGDGDDDDDDGNVHDDVYNHDFVLGGQ